MQIDKEIISGCNKGDRRSQFKLYELCYSYLMGIALRYNPSQEAAAAAVNMAFLKVLNNMSQYKIDLSFKAWIRRIMVNTLIDEYRKTKVRMPEKSIMEYQQDMNMNGIHVHYNEAESNLQVEQLVDFIHKLNPLTGNVFNLFVVDGYAHKDIADMLEISESASKWHLFTARKQLQDMVLNSNKNLNPTSTDSIKVKINSL
ncbi:MAG: sigma-70 family RNA polymerase sigma factor [Saprospiraceae bacterium]